MGKPRWAVTGIQSPIAAQRFAKLSGPFVGLVGHRLRKKLESIPICKFNLSDGHSCVQRL